MTGMRYETREQRARRAVENFHRLEPQLSAFARVLTGRPDVIVRAAGGVPCTDGDTIYMRPYMEMADANRHPERRLCNKRDHDGILLCVGCRAHQATLTTLFHEVAHIAYESFQAMTEKEKVEVVERAVKEWGAKTGSKRAELIRKRFEARPPKNYVEANAHISPFLPIIFNCLEDARVNALTFKAYAGTYDWFKGRTVHIFEHGIEQEDGSVSLWREAPPNGQVTIGLFCMASKMDYTGWFTPEVEHALNDDVLQALVAKMDDAEDARDVYMLGFPILERLRELGYCKMPDDPEPEPEPDNEDTGGDSDDVGGEDATGEVDPTGSGASSGGSSPDADGDSESEDEDYNGASDDTDDADDATDDDDDADEGAGAGSDDADDADEGDDDATGAGSDDADDADEGDDDGTGAGSDDDDAWDADDGSDMDGTDDAGDTSSGDGASTGAGGDPTTDAADDVDAEGEGDAATPQDGDEATAGGDGLPSEDYVEIEVWGTPEDVEELLKIFGGHEEEHASERDDDEDKKEIDRAIVQEEHFDEVSTGTYGLNEWTWDQRYQPRTGANRIWVAPDDYSGRGRPEVPESILAPALNKLRVVFSDNQKWNQERNRRSGRVNTKVLGRRAPVGDDRLFSKRNLPGKKDYHVVIAMDISGSTSWGWLRLIKAAAWAQAEMLSRLGVPFEVYAHTGSLGYLIPGTPNAVDIFVVKRPEEPWSNEQKERLIALTAANANLDGHNMEYYRKRLDKATATRRIIMYYTDGAMPAENYTEELRILQREIAECRKRGYTVVGVGVGNDDPNKHGLETVRIDSVNDLHRVVDRLREKLT